ncbi:MAG: hypothetical protein IKI15_03705 [Lachnospiraceae bacterium]|nr:hypothetical protein [Lachnospiraceae bacterium]
MKSIIDIERQEGALDNTYVVNRRLRKRALAKSILILLILTAILPGCGNKPQQPSDQPSPTPLSKVYLEPHMWTGLQVAGYSMQLLSISQPYPVVGRSDETELICFVFAGKNECIGVLHGYGSLQDDTLRMKNPMLIRKEEELITELFRKEEEVCVYYSGGALCVAGKNNQKGVLIAGAGYDEAYLPVEDQFQEIALTWLSRKGGDAVSD